MAGGMKRSPSGLQPDYRQRLVHPLHTGGEGRIVNVACVIATAVNADSRREILGLDLLTSEDGAGWTAFLRDLVARGLTRVQLVISDAHEGLRGAIGAVLPGSTWQRCRVHFVRNLQRNPGSQPYDGLPVRQARVFAIWHAPRMTKNAPNSVSSMRPEVFQPRESTEVGAVPIDLGQSKSVAQAIGQVPVVVLLEGGVR